MSGSRALLICLGLLYQFGAPAGSEQTRRLPRAITQQAAVNEWGMLNSDASSDERIAAAVALFALRVSVPNAGEPIVGYIVLPELSPVTEAQAIEQLTLLPKPALCAAGRFQTAVVLSCWGRGQLPENSVAFRRQEDMVQGEPTVTEQGASPLRIAVEGTSPRIDLSRDQYRLFLSEYFLPFVAWSLGRAPGSLQEKGIDKVLKIGSAETSSVRVLGNDTTR